jgi:hypothetical protein
MPLLSFSGIIVCFGRQNIRLICDYLQSSLVEMFKKIYGNGGENSSLSVMRTFRLLRLVKVVRFMPSLRRQLAAMMRTIGNLSVFLLLFNLFVFIFR